MPLYVVFPGDGGEGEVLPTVLTQAVVAEAAGPRQAMKLTQPPLCLPRWWRARSASLASLWLGGSPLLRPAGQRVLQAAMDASAPRRRPG